MTYDFIILGFGKGGKTLAGALAKQGRTVALVERSSRMYGGTCINVGCIPSKSLVTSAAASAQLPDAPFSEKAARYAAAIAEKRRVTGMLRQKNYDKLHTLEQVTIYDGEASFRSATQVDITSEAGVQTITGAHVLINTGASPIPLDLPGLAGNPAVYTSETLMEEERLPRRLALIGAGYIGMEFASMYANFGSQVTVLQDGTTFLPKEDRDVAEEIRAILERRGVQILLGAKPTALRGGQISYMQNGVAQTLEADGILIATGRRPNTAALHPERAGVSLTPRGAVAVDALLRTTAPNIWAMGDVAGGLQFTYISLDDSRIILSQLTGGAPRTTAQRSNVPYSVFMDTPLSRVGLTEQEAAGQGLPFRVVKLPTAAVPKAQVLRKTEGFLKALIHTETGEILGAALLCPESYELINTIKLAMDLGADYTALRDRIYTHPTMTEALNDLFAL